jgi:hypothetical protein
MHRSLNVYPIPPRLPCLHRARSAVNIGSLITRRDNDRDLWRTLGRRRLGGLQILQKIALLESAGDQPDHGR